MTVDRPTPGNLIKTVDELVDAVNSGSSVDWSDVEVDGNINITATPGGSSIALTADAGNAVIAADGNGITLNSPNIGFFGQNPTPRPDSVTADVALSDLGLVTNIVPSSGAFSDLVQVADDGSVSTLPDGSPALMVFDPTAAGGAYYRTNGTAFTIGEGVCVVNADGWYDVDTSLVVGGGSVADAYAFVLFYINGAPSVNGLPSHSFVPQNTPAVALQGRLKRVHLTASDYIQVAGLASGDALPVQVCLTVATRVA